MFFDEKIIEEAYKKTSDWTGQELSEVDKVIELLENGEVTAVKKQGMKWVAQEAVKKAILVKFRSSHSTEMNFGLPFYDKWGIRSDFSTIPARVVPGGSSVRRGAFLGKNVIIMPPSYVNVGAFIDENTMIDSHVLVGSCAHIGKNVHLSAGVMIGGVLEPPQATPVVIEDNVFVGGNSGVYEGFVLEENAVIGSGVILNASTQVIDVETNAVVKGIIPRNSVVIPGARKKNVNGNEFYVSTPLIVKKRDEKTDARTSLEQALRV
jgi:2,3,4,5-tetrahydropyridine-2-carboxylate N-succinyltransferase